MPGPSCQPPVPSIAWGCPGNEDGPLRMTTKGMRNHQWMRCDRKEDDKWHIEKAHLIMGSLWPLPIVNCLWSTNTWSSINWPRPTHSIGFPFREGRRRRRNRIRKGTSSNGIIDPPIEIRYGVCFTFIRRTIETISSLSIWVDRCGDSYWEKWISRDARTVSSRERDL